MLLKFCLFVAFTAFVSGNAVPNFAQHFKQVTLRPDSKRPVNEAAVLCEPELVPLLLVSWFTNVILVEWTAPESCVTGFIVNLNDTTREVAFSESTEIYSTLYQAVEACTDYYVGVTVVGEDEGSFGETAGVSLTTLRPFGPGRVTDISATVNDDSWLLHWNPPFLEGNCITEYDVYIYENQNYTNSINTRTTSPNYEVGSFVPCMQYGVRIVPFIDELGGNQISELIFLPGRVLSPPTVVSTEVSSTLVSIRVSLEPYASNTCQVLYVTVEFTADGSTWNGFNQLYQDSRERPEIDIGVEGLAESTTYTFRVSVTSIDGTSEPSETFTLTTP